jgi:hypothetical protein
MTLHISGTDNATGRATAGLRDPCRKNQPSFHKRLFLIAWISAA